MRVESGRTVNALELIRKYWFANELIRRTHDHPSAEVTESSGDYVSYVLALVHTSFAMWISLMQFMSRFVSGAA